MTTKAIPNHYEYDETLAPWQWRLQKMVSTATSDDGNRSRRLVVAGIMALSLLAFELFNFDTTRFALSDFLGGAQFIKFSWAGILALAFCAIDFAGLVRLFAPDQAEGVSKEVWYLTGAWLLGATMNAVMTWWAVSLTLLNHDFGNEVLTRAQLLKAVPIFVAVLVWLTRILFIAAVTVTGEKLLNGSSQKTVKRRVNRKAVQIRELKSEPVFVEPTEAVAGQQLLIKERQPGDGVSHRPQPLVYVAAEPVVPVVTEVEPVIEPVVAAEQPTLVDVPPIRAPRSQRSHARVRRRPPVAGPRIGSIPLSHSGLHAKSAR